MTFLPGQITNPGGIPRHVRLARHQVLRGAALFAPKVVQLLWDIVNDTQIAAADRIKAGKELLDRACGKAQQSVDITGQVNSNHAITFSFPVLNQLPNLNPECNQVVVSHQNNKTVDLQTGSTPSVIDVLVQPIETALDDVSNTQDDSETDSRDS